MKNKKKYFHSIVWAQPVWLHSYHKWLFSNRYLTGRILSEFHFKVFLAISVRLVLANSMPVFSAIHSIYFNFRVSLFHSFCSRRRSSTFWYVWVVTLYLFSRHLSKMISNCSLSAHDKYILYSHVLCIWLIWAETFDLIWNTSIAVVLIASVIH